MSGKQWLVLAGLTLAAAGRLAGEAQGGSLTGAVNDRGEQRAKGISGAKVNLIPPVRGPDGPDHYTDADGRYDIHNVPDGDYTLFISMVGYRRYPEQLQVRVAGETTAPVVWLTLESGNPEYYAVVADTMISSVEAAPHESQSNVGRKEWEHLRVINLPPSSRAQVARALTNKSPATQAWTPEIETYSTTNSEAIKRTEVLFGEALAGRSPVPDQGALRGLNISPKIVGDVAGCWLKGGTESVMKKMAFEKDFLQKWGDTPATEQYRRYQTPEFKILKP